MKRHGDPADRGAAPDCCRIVHPASSRNEDGQALSRASRLNTSAGRLRMTWEEPRGERRTRRQHGRERGSGAKGGKN